MTRQELLDSINLSEEFIAADRQNRPGDKIEVRKLTIHNTDNSDKGANAKAHSSFVRLTGYYMLNGKKQWVSWHYTVDDTRAIQHLPDNERAYHAGSSANSTSLAMEICMNSDNNQPVCDDRAARLAALILYAHDLTVGDMVTHESWTGKKCPVLLRAPAKWAAFQKAVKGYLDGIQSNKDAKLVAKGRAAKFTFKACHCTKGSDHEMA
jgi:N-acetylmuramoyl-L-alanine amidase CwlA